MQNKLPTKKQLNWIVERHLEYMVEDAPTCSQLAFRMNHWIRNRKKQREIDKRLYAK